jgi:trehalose-phosphatase
MDAIGFAVNEWPQLVAVAPAGFAERVAAAARILLFLDFDGTLAPIASDPEDAALPGATRTALVSLSADENIKLVFISGRKLEDLERRVGVAGAIYAGNHGFEIEGPGIAYLHPESDFARPLIQSLESALRSLLTGVPGALVENKGLTLSVHYRRVPVDDFPAVARAVQAVSAAYGDSMEQTMGRKIFEFRPRVGWHKGAAAAWIRERVGTPDALPIYIGDDRTDEDAFRALDGAVTIHAGESQHTAAAYRLNGPQAVREFLEWLRKIRRKGAREE